MAAFVFDSIADPISVIDEDRVYRAVNEAWCRMTGLHREQVVGRPLREVLRGAVPESLRDALRDCLDRGETVRVREPIVLPDGVPRWFDISYFPFRDPDEPERSAVVMAHDVTTEEQLSREQARSVENLRVVLEATNDAMGAVDAEDRIVWLNKRFADLLELPIEALIGVHRSVARAQRLKLAADPAAEDAQVEATYRERRYAEDRMVFRDGRVFARSSVPMRSDAGAGVVGRVWSIRDITREERALATLRDSEANARRLAVVASHTGNSVMLCDADGRIEWTNPAFTAMTGWSADEARGKLPKELLDGPGTDAAPAAAMRGRLLGGEPARGELLRYRRDGSTYWGELEVVPVRRADGSIASFAAIETDITPRKRREQELVEARRAAEAANQAKSRFLSNMSHELRTPLNAVLGFAQLLAMNEAEPLAPAQRRQVDEIVRGGRHLLALIEQLLDLSRIEAGRLPLAMEAVDLQDLLTECVEFIRPLADERGLALEKLCSIERYPPAAADPMRVRQVLMNLLSNAVKYNRPNGSIAVGYERRGDRLRIVVRDTGPGLAHAQRERLFQPFERLGAERGAVSGAGVGLALSRELMSLMGGEIGVDSMPGEGSAFWIELRLAS